MYCDITIFYKEKKEKIRAILDTGNFLQDPITNIPVVIVERDSLNTILPRRILENTDKIIMGQYSFMDDELECISKLRVLPFSSLGKQNGMLLGFKVDKIEVSINEEEIKKENIIIGIYEKKLSDKNNYVGLIGLNCMESQD